MIQSIQRAIEILNVVASSFDTPPTLKYISEKTGLNKSTCSHIIETLLDNAMLVKLSTSKGYCIGPHAYLLTKNSRYNNEFLNYTKPVMKWLNQKTNKSVTLATVVNNKKFIIDYFQEDVLICSTKPPIFEDNFYNSATGILLLANLSKEEIFNVYKESGLPPSNLWPKVKNFQDLLKALNCIKKHKIFKHVIYGEDGAEETAGYASVIEYNTKTYGALGIACKLSELTESPDEEKKLIHYLTVATNEVVRRISLDDCENNI